MKHLPAAALSLTASALAVPLPSASAQIETNQPNILFILVDDLGSRDLGIEGSKYHETPNIDRLAKSGMRFACGYAACQVCSPSRAALMTGQYPARVGITDWIGAPSGKKWRRNDRVLPAEYLHHLPANCVTLAEALKKSGYKTFFAGKWHLGGKGSLPTNHGFDINIGGFHAGSPHGGYFSPYNNPYLKDGPAGEWLPTRLAAETCKFMEENKDGPFLAYLSFYAVHGQIQTTRELWTKYRDKAVKMGMDKVGPVFIFDRRLPVRQVQNNPVYAGLMEMMDDGVGLVLDKLDELGLADNTIVVFTGDNGSVTSGDCYSTSVLPFRGGKGRQWEGGFRVPFYVRVPGMTKPGSTCDTPVIGVDFYPTLLELAGVNLPKNYNVDGMSIVPLLKGRKIPQRDIFWHYPHYGNQGGEPSSVIRSGKMKLIHYWEDGRDELYDLSSDIGEHCDIASAHPETVKRLHTKLNNWLTEVQAKIPQPDPRYNAAKKQKQLRQIRINKTKALTRQSHKMLQPSWKAPRNWWGSAPPAKQK
jgi:arylsulfatase A-like enzyme